MRPSGSQPARVRHPLLPTAERGESIGSADDIDREITALKDRLTALDRERSTLADRLSVLEHARVREPANQQPPRLAARVTTASPTAEKIALFRGLFRGRDVKGKAVLVHTGWDVHWRTERYGSGHPYLTRAAAEHLVAAGAALVGIDSLNIDDATDGARPVHSMLLAAGIPIVEHLCALGELPDDGFRFYAVPPRVKGMGSFPVRAFAALEE